MKGQYQPGDWVRFFKAGTLVIGVVQYVDNKYDPLEEMLVTEHGWVACRNVLEVRRKVGREEDALGR